MNYCLFENTYYDLLRCKDALEGAESVRAYKENASSQVEKEYITKLIFLCGDIAKDFLNEAEG